MPEMKNLFAIVAVSLSLLAGCQRQTYVERQPVDLGPMVIDQAMQQRQWEPVTAYYETGDTRHSTTGFGYAPRRDLPPPAFALADTGTFFVNLVTMPYTLYEQWNGVDSGGVKLPPSYTAVPPMPPSTQPAE
ncbi:MAG TPA: hypothetical protein VF595_11070 [Tepidisphaeraceae bacterium]|jgi:hypothetical protein